MKYICRYFLTIKILQFPYFITYFVSWFFHIFELWIFLTLQQLFFWPIKPGPVEPRVPGGSFLALPLCLKPSCYFLLLLKSISNPECPTEAKFVTKIFSNYLDSNERYPWTKRCSKRKIWFLFCLKTANHLR